MKHEIIKLLIVFEKLGFKYLYYVFKLIDY